MRRHSGLGVLELAAGPAEGVIKRADRIGEAFVIVTQAAHIDFASIRQGEADMNFVQAAGAMMTARRRDNDAAGRYPPKALFQLGDLVMDPGAQSFARLRALKINLNGSLHGCEESRLRAKAGNPQPATVHSEVSS